MYAHNICNLTVRILFIACLWWVASPAFAQTSPPHEGETYTIVAGGDVMLGRRISKLINTVGGGDPAYPWNYIAPTFSAADISFVNLEAVASQIGKPLDKRYTFRFNPDMLLGLASAGVDVVSQANNHALDYGYDAMCDSYKNITALGIAVVGTGCNRDQANAPSIQVLPDGTRVAFYAMTAFYQGNTATAVRPGFAPFSISGMIRSAHDIKSTNDADIVIVSVHTGTEHKFTPDVQTENWYRELIDGGVDVVLGHHPHVPQRIEKYGDGWIVYSLGNLIFDMHDAIPHTKRQILAKITIQDGVVQSVRRIPIEMNDTFQPYLLRDKWRIRNGLWYEPVPGEMSQ